MGVNVGMIFGFMSLIGSDTDIAGHCRHHPDRRHGDRLERAVYERIREEARMGRSVVSALDSGFKPRAGDHRRRH